MRSLDLLLENRPPWTSIERRSSAGAEITASPPGAGGGAARTFRLSLRPSSKRGVCVMEQASNRQLPESCIERHINSDGSFCVFFGSESEITDQHAATSWWSSLATYLNNQRYAEKHKVWPLASGLSHGDAAHEQIAMENLAEPLGWKDDLWRAMFRGKAWIAGRLPRASKDLDRVLNVRTPCPRGCTRKHKLLRKRSCETQDCYTDCAKQHKPVLRAECPNRAVVEALVLHEHRRRKIESEIVEGLLKKGKRCCGTMKNCPLRRISAH